MSKKYRERGFTLIELLVVIAIIAILAAILFPVFARARENARKTTCLSNAKQIATSLAMYVQDYDQAYPYYMITRPAGWPYAYMSGDLSASMQMDSWPMDLEPYMKNCKVFFCPSDPNSSQAPAKPLDNPTLRSSYVYRYCLAWFAEGKWGRPLCETDFDRPADTVMIYESKDWHADKYGLWHSGTNYPGAVLLNSVYADGHAKIWKMSKHDNNGVFDPNWLTNTENNSDGWWNPAIGHD
ncbi:MAG TPA: prepilin-type N-terminal cleavage/methylation domain-containing protein [Armatimonadota bacterium]|nr:prepilin-type N-terminal cleavage/methylation domain-containing protein [Armatimonadota bacterium]